MMTQAGHRAKPPQGHLRKFVPRPLSWVARIVSRSSRYNLEAPRSLKEHQTNWLKMALDRTSYADFLIAELRKAAPGRFELQRINGSRFTASFEQSGITRHYRVLAFAIGGSGRNRLLERRVEVTSTYAGNNLQPLPGYLDIVLGIEREQSLLIGLDRRRLTTGGRAHNASNFVYVPSLDRLTVSPYVALQNERQKLFLNEYQIYMRPDFLPIYLDEEHTLHSSGLRAVPAKHVDDRLASQINRLDAIGSKKKLDYDQQIQLVLKKMQIGQLGESIAFTAECERLRSKKLFSLESKVSWVSQIQPFLGYDIVSFSNSSDIEYVEVKSSISQMRSFYFTANEMRQARRLGDAYRLVCVSEVFGQPTIREYRNPIEAIARGDLAVESDTSLIRIK